MNFQSKFQQAAAKYQPQPKTKVEQLLLWLQNNGFYYDHNEDKYMTQCGTVFIYIDFLCCDEELSLAVEENYEDATEVRIFCINFGQDENLVIVDFQIGEEDSDTEWTVDAVIECIESIPDKL